MATGKTNPTDLKFKTCIFHVYFFNVHYIDDDDDSLTTSQRGSRHGM